MTRDQALEHAEAWWSHQDEQLDWLAKRMRCSVEELHDDVMRDRAWRWHWSGASRDEAGDPTVLAWLEQVPGVYEFPVGQLIAGDALSHLSESYLRTRLPDLRRTVLPAMKDAVESRQPALVGRDPRWGVWLIEDARILSTTPAYDPDRYEDLLKFRIESSIRTYELQLTDGAEPEPLVEVEKAASPDDKWDLWLADTIAYDNEDQVPAFIEHLESSTGVSHAFHQDREIINVGGRISRKRLLEVSLSWWEANGRFRPHAD